MNQSNQGKKRLVAIKNFDIETYRLVKTYASLEGRTVASIFEEAVSSWLESRGNYEEIRLWTGLEQAYKENFEVFRENRSIFKNHGEGYVLICDQRIIGVFSDYDEVLRNFRENCRRNALVIKLPYEKEELELGLPW
jgi:transcription elongation factor GreA-like protein